MNDDINKHDMNEEEMEQCAPGCVCKKIKKKDKTRIIIYMLLAIALMFISMYAFTNKGHNTQDVTYTNHIDKTNK